MLTKNTELTSTIIQMTILELILKSVKQVNVNLITEKKSVKFYETIRGT